MENKHLDLFKVITIIDMAKRALEKQESYRVVMYVTNTELVELRKHFSVSLEGQLRDKDIYIIKNK